jgi:hypothetical protein
LLLFRFLHGLFLSLLSQDNRVPKKLLVPLFFYTLVVAMGSSSTSSGPVPVLRCPVLFNGTNHRDWVPHMRLHMRGLRLWDFLTGELPCLPSPSAPAQPVITEKTTAAEKEALLANYDDYLASYESRFRAYKTWLDEDARGGSVLVASMDD